jgi:peptidoglycan/LPS O-acetylase OafA/YrhL
MKIDSNHRLKNLDGVRGIAILLVLSVHLFGVGFGWVGVDLFFVLSGFLIGNILLETKNKHKYFKKFYFRRILRIFPLYYLVLLCIYSPYYLFDFSLPYFENRWSYFVYGQNFDYVFFTRPSGMFCLMHFWSLAVEEHFYFILPFLVYFFSKKNLTIALFLLSFLSLFSRIYFYSIGDPNMATYHLTFCRIDALCIGTILAVNFEKINNFSYKNSIFYALGLMVMVLFCLGVKPENVHFATFGLSLLDIFFAMFILQTFKEDFYLKKYVSKSIFTWFGKYAYGIYVFHWIFHALLKTYFEASFSHFSNLPIWGVKLFFAASSLILTLGTAYFSFHYFESYFLKLKKTYE